MNDQWTNRLSEYLDDELDANERDALEAHLATCGHCYATLGELRQVVARAKAMEDQPPATDLWPSLRARLTPARRVEVRTHRRFSFTIPQLMAASLALVLLSGGTVWMTQRSRGSAAFTPTPDAVNPSSFQPASNGRWRVQTDIAVAELEETLSRNQGELDTATVRVVRQNLAVIDHAIGQAQRALRRDPGNLYLNLHLANTMRQKIELLRRANALATSQS